MVEAVVYLPNDVTMFQPLQNLQFALSSRRGKNFLDDKLLAISLNILLIKIFTLKYVLLIKTLPYAQPTWPLLSQNDPILRQ